MWSMSSSVSARGPLRISASRIAVSSRRNGSGSPPAGRGGALEDQRLEDRGVEPAERLGLALEGAVGDRLVLERQAERALEERVDVAHLERAVAVGRAQLGMLDRRDLEALPQRHGERLLRVPRRLTDQAMRGEDGEAGVLERDEAHEHVAVLALAA